MRGLISMVCSISKENIRCLDCTATHILNASDYDGNIVNFTRRNCTKSSVTR